MLKSLKIFYFYRVLKSSVKKEVMFFIGILMEGTPFLPHHKGRDVGRSLTR